MGRRSKSETGDSFSKLIEKKLSSNKTVNIIEKESKLPSKNKKESIKKDQIDTDNPSGDSNYRIINKRFPPNFNLDFKVFQSIPTDKKVNKFTDRGTRVYVARYPEFYKIYLIKYHDVGSHGFPNGGITVYNATFEQVQHHHIDSVMLHNKTDKCKIYGESNI